MPSLDSKIRSRRADSWNAVYNLIQQEAGATTTLLDFASSGHLLNAATWTGRKFNASGLSPTWTPESALSAWDIPFDLTVESNWLGDAPILTFNGTAEQADTPDAAHWSTAGAFSVWAWIYLNTAASNVILAKWDETSAGDAQLREWLLGTDSNGDIGFRIYDESQNAEVSRKQETALVIGRWYFVVGTFSGGTDAADVSVAVNGVLTDDADILDDATFADAEDLATVVSLGYLEGTGGSLESFFDGKMLGGPWSPGFALLELTAEQIFNMYEGMRLGLGI